jgi:hypothetical protein
VQHHKNAAVAHDSEQQVSLHNLPAAAAFDEPDMMDQQVGPSETASDTGEAADSEKAAVACTAEAAVVDFAG